MPRSDTETFIAGGGMETKKFDTQLKNRLAANARAGQSSADRNNEEDMEPGIVGRGAEKSFKMTRQQHGSVANAEDLKKKKKCSC